MKKYLSAAATASLLLFPSAMRADDTTSATPATTGSSSFSSDKEKVSYSMGVDMGRNLEKQGIDVDPDVLLQGIKDGIGGGALKMTDEEMQATMQTFIQGMREKMMAKQKAEGVDNKSKGEAFLEANKKKAGWQTTPSGLEYKVITTGTGEKPKASDTVVTQYRGTLIDGTEFDSSYKRNQPAEFPVNAVIPGWTEALQMMPVGSKWELAIPASLAYGENAPPQIGPNSVLLFDVELLGIKKPDANASPSPAGDGK
ncbi:MAG TPA: FKBP-type peptidyl-prolyl cis-trans isomerase [Chthoniobacteraceae bacterium]|jgi:FKBP-type peptidyl-prolyl cis-trans isomerase|nr:FKBP-type peptidyl-prolyl cis-trans isomerase [Chthoniobacteraceae bacterium]